MGQAFGEAFRDDLRRLLEIRLERTADFTRHLGQTTVSAARILELTQSHLEAHRKFDPAIWEEFAAIADAAHLSETELLLVNGYTDLRDYVLCQCARPAGDGHLGECSAFLIPARRAANAQPLIGQTWDLHNDAMPFVVAVHRKPSEGPQTLCMTTMGCLPLIGMNEHGLAIGTTNLTGCDARIGVSYLFTITAALQHRTAREAANFIETVPRLSGHDFLLADAAETINLETSALRCARTTVTDSPFAHTNHFLDPALQPLEWPKNLAGTRFRQQRMTENLAALSGPITMDQAWNLLTDDTRCHGAAICNEDYHGQQGTIATLASIVQCPAQRKMFLCRGGARLGEKQVLTLQ